MKTRPLHILFPALLVAVLFFGCGRKPGEKLYHEALAEQERGNLVRARALLEKSIRRRAGSLENADACNRLGILLWEMGEIDSAVDAFHDSCRMDAEQYDVLCNLGIALNAQGSFEEAERIFREAALVKPGDPRPLAFAGAAYVQNGRWAEAQRNLRRALKRNPNSPSLQNALALAELHTADAEAALKQLQAIARQHPGYAPALFNIASIYQSWIRNPIEAKRWYERYLKQVPDMDGFSDRARKQLEKIAEEAQRRRRASQTGTNPDRKKAEPLFKQALELHKAGKFSEAASGYQAAVDQDPTYTQAFYNLGLVYYADNQMESASEAFAKAVELNPAFVSARYNRALTAYNLGDTGLARRELANVLAQQPGYQPAIDLLARLGAE